MLIIPHIPDAEARYSGIHVCINNTPVETPVCRVSAMPYNTVWPGHQRPQDQTELAPFLSFEADEAVTLTVTYTHDIQQVLVRPLARGIQAELVQPRTVCFTLPAPGAYTVEADGFHEALHVFYNPIKDINAIPVASGRTLLRYGPGVHHIGKVELFSDTTVLLDRDAYVYGCFTAICAENIDIVGYGVLDGSEELRQDQHELLLYDYDKPLPIDREGILTALEDCHVLDGLVRFYRCRNVRLEGLILRDSSTFAVIPAACENCVIENVKTIGMWRYNSDGIDLFNCTNVLIRHCFLRDFDDCIVIKGIAGWDVPAVAEGRGAAVSGNNENILVEGCVVWCDWGRNLELGAETCAPQFRNIIFSNCDCIHSSTAHMDIQHHNRADIHHVTFENIRVEYTSHQLPNRYQSDMQASYPADLRATIPAEHPRAMALPICRSGMFAHDGLNGNIHDILFRDIYVLTDHADVSMPISEFRGVDEDHRVYGVRVENVYYRGQRMNTAEEMHLALGAFVEDVLVR